MARRKISPSCISPWPGSDRRRWPGGGRESTWVKRSLMGDQIAGQQLVAGLDQGRQRHPQQGGQRAVAVERQPVLVGHGGEEEVQQHGLAREMRHVLAHEATVHPGPAGCGRTPQSRGNQNAFWDHAWAPER